MATRTATKISLLGFLGITIYCVAAFAEEPSSHNDEDPSHDPIHHVHGSHPECPLPKSALDLVRCAQENHPDVLRAKLTAEPAHKLPDVGGQLSNPEAEVQSVFGQNLGDQQMQTQISLVQPLELGGRRSARIKEGEAKRDQAVADVREVQSGVIIQTVLNLHRLRQLVREKASIDEAIRAFGRLASQHRSRPRLPPEQEVSLAVFEMAEADYRIRKSVLVQEEREIGHFFHIATGHALDEIVTLLPMAPSVWPEVTEQAQSLGPSPSLAKLVTNQGFAVAELERARAESWPDLRVGPMIQLQADGGLRSQLYGFQLNMPLPFLSLNGAAREYATVGVASSERTIELQKRFESHERAEQVRVYRGAVQALKEAGSIQSIEKRHQKIEGLSLRGLVSSSLVIEAHRQLIELEKNIHERELKSLSSLWQIYRFDGRVFKESL